MRCREITVQMEQPFNTYNAVELNVPHFKKNKANRTLAVLVDLNMPHVLYIWDK